jgi:hypothetical protein
MAMVLRFTDRTRGEVYTLDTRISHVSVVLVVLLVSMLWLVVVHVPLAYGTSFQIDIGPRIFMGGIEAGWPPSFAYEDLWIEGWLWGLDNRIGFLTSVLVLQLHNMALPSYTTYQVGIALQRLWEDDGSLRVELRTLNKLHYPAHHWWGYSYYHYVKYYLDVALSKRWLIGDHNPTSEGFWSDQFMQVVAGVSGGIMWVKGSVQTSWFVEFSVGGDWSWVWMQRDTN